jgi:hypothetical protein
MRRPGSQHCQGIALVFVSAGLLLVPLGLRAVNVAVRSPTAVASYLPSIESPRQRLPFDTEAVAALREASNDFILIGDSMAGTRINPGHLSRLIGGHGAAALFHPGCGSAYWYLTFKNLVVNAGLRPRAVIFFFRDENLTDPLFRVYPSALDRVARDQEPVLDEILAARANGTFYRLHRAARTLYQYDQTRAWLEPMLIKAPVAWSAGRRARKKLLDTINNEVFTLEALRPSAAADMQTGNGAAFDFERNVATSVLPEVLRIAKTSGIRAAFVRVQRRPVGNAPPNQPPALQKYVRQLREYLAANGAVFRDDWGDPDLPLSIYEDGDHIGRDFRQYYTELFYRKNPEIFR